MLDHLLTFIARLACRRPWIVVLLSAVLAALGAVYAATSLRMNADTDDLIARDRPFMAQYNAFLEEFGDLEYIYVVLEDGRDETRTRAAANALAERLSQIEVLPGVFHAVSPEEQLRIATRAMSDAELAELGRSAAAFPALMSGHPSIVINRASDLLRELTRPGAGHTDDEQQRLGTSAVLLLKSLAAALPDSDSRADLAFALPDSQAAEYLTSASGELYFIIIMPVKDYGTMSVIEEPIRRIRAAMDEVRATYPDVPMGLTGKPVLQADEMRTTERDMTRASTLAVALVSVLFMLVIGGVWRPALAVLALLMAIAWTFGLTTLVIGQLNLLSIVFTLVLVGVGIDFGVHVVARYREELRTRAVEEAIASTLRTACRGNITGALTSSLAFFMALFTEFQGLRELGFIAGTGLILCLIAMTVTLPALLMIFDGRGSQSRVSLRETSAAPEVGSRLWHWMIDRPRTMIAITVAVTLLLTPALFKVGFQSNLLELQAQGLESVEWEHRILEDSANTWFGAVVADDQAAALELQRRALERPTVGSVQSVFDLIEPDSPVRDEYRAALHEPEVAPRRSDRPAEPEAPRAWDREELVRLAGVIDTLADGAARAAPEEAAGLRTLAAELRQLGDALRADPVVARERVRETVTAIGASIDVMLNGDRLPLREALPGAVRDRYVSPRGKYLVTLHPRENVWEYEPMKRFVEDMLAVDPNATGVPITQFRSLNEMRSAFQTAALLALVAVFFLLIVDLRSVRWAVFAILPLLVGVIWLIQFMGAMGIEFNLANFFAVPILIGISVDSGIHIIRRYLENSETVTANDDAAAWQRLQLGSTRRAVFVTSMTTMIGFGCLILALHQGLQSLGFVMLIGAASCLIASLLVLPAILAIFDHRLHPPAESRT